jgi:hypothetical protein
MASDYGLNFGFRRSDESMLSGREGRLKVPVAATDWKQGDFVTFDPANPGFMKKAAADTPIEPGYSGFVIQEDAWDVGIHENQVMNSYYLADIKPGRLAAIWTGAGAKVWMKNTDAVARIGGIARAAVNRFTMGGTPLVIGDYISWNGTTYVKAGSKAVAVARVTLSNGTNYIEATWLA